MFQWEFDILHFASFLTASVCVCVGGWRDRAPTSFISALLSPSLPVLIHEPAREVIRAGSPPQSQEQVGWGNWLCWRYGAGCGQEMGDLRRRRASGIHWAKKEKDRGRKKEAGLGNPSKLLSGFCPLRGTPPLNGKSFCQENLSGKGGYNPPP